MAKKKFNISQTLKKNKNNPSEIELPKKVILPKKAIEDEAVKKKVKAIEQPKKEVESKAKRKPKKEEKPPKLVRLTIDTPEAMHRKLKIRSIESGLSMRDYVLRLIEKSLK